MTWKAVLLLVVSNVFMTLAWYGHLKFKQSPLWAAVILSWGLAFFEYIFQVPANRIGNEVLSVMQLKVIQEAVTLVVFTLLAFFLFGETLKWNNVVSYALLVAAVFFAFL
jgi:uncharacterized protein (DUF486 family)